MKVIIIGAGLGGLSAAYRFAKSGHDVQVFERGRQLNSTGGGISIRPSACRIIKSWGLQSLLEQICDRSPSVTYRDLKTGNVLHTNVDAPEHADFGTTRRAMIKLLYKQALSAGARIYFDATVAHVFDDALMAAVVLENGERAYGDIVLAADGIKSRTRQAVLSGVGPDRNWEPILDKTTFYSFDMPLSDLTDDPSTMKLTQNSDITTWMGNGGFVVTRFSAKFKRIGLLFAIQEQTDQESLWDKHGDIEKVRKFFSASCDDLTKALEVTDTCDRWRVAEVPNLPRWCSSAGRIVLLGDSVHAMHPNAAQGFSTTLEDIGVLDFLFSHFSAQPEVGAPKIVKNWQAICKPRAERVKDFARWSTTLLGGQDRPGRHAIPGSTQADILEKDVLGMEADFGSSKFWKWNVEYDAILEAKRYLASQVTSKL